MSCWLAERNRLAKWAEGAEAMRKADWDEPTAQIRAPPSHTEPRGTSRERQKREFGEFIKDWPNSEVQPTLGRISRKRKPQDGPSAGLSKPSNAH